MAAEGQVIACHTVDHWNDQLEKAKVSKKLVVVDFTATWCPPCRMMAPIFAQLSTILTHVVFLKVDVDELQSVSEEWGVEAMPTFLVLKDGSLVERVIGARKKDELEIVITKHATTPVAAPVAASASA